MIHAVWRTAKLLTSFTSVLVAAFAFVGLGKFLLYKHVMHTCFHILNYTYSTYRYLIACLFSVHEAKADTEKEKKKRRDKLKKDYEREKFERLFDERVIVNRSRFQACDRSRPLYEFQVG